MFSLWGDRWFRREWKLQCRHKDVLRRQRCQGVDGHEGPHWYYGPDGSFHQSFRKETITKPSDIASSSTPPDHKDYVPPSEMVKHLHHCHYEDSEVTDPDEIARLNAGEMRNGESITRPCSEEDMEMLKLRGCLPDRLIEKMEDEQ